MRSLPAAVAVLALSASVLVGCASAPSNGCDRPTSAATDQVDLLTVEGALGASPTVRFPTPLHATTTQWRDVVTGDGEPVASPAQLVLLDITMFTGDTGAGTVVTKYDGSDANAVPLSQWATALPGITDALACATEGSRVAVTFAPDGMSDEVRAGFGLGDADSAVAVIDLTRVYPDRATGADQYTESHGLPTVVRADSGRPGVIIPDGAPPAELVVQTLKRGDGPVVQPTDAVRVQYTGLVWSDRSVFDSTWDAVPASIVPAQTVPGFAAAFRDATVGSQILVVIPPDQGYGSQAAGPIPGGSTLVFVIDVLGIDHG